jgi:hypothetical protein
MPWNAQDGDTTGLYQWCAVVLLWHILVQPGDVQQVSGLVNNEFLNRVISERDLARLLPPPKE